MANTILPGLTPSPGVADGDLLYQVTANGLTEYRATRAQVCAQTFRQLSSAAAVAAAGTTQGTATPLSAEVNNVTSAVAGAATGVLLAAPPAGIAQPLVVINSSAAALSVYPPTGGQIGLLGVNAPLVIPVGALARLLSVSPTQWFAQVAAATPAASTLLTGLRFAFLMGENNSTRVDSTGTVTTGLGQHGSGNIASVAGLGGFNATQFVAANTSYFSDLGIGGDGVGFHFPGSFEGNVWISPTSLGNQCFLSQEQSVAEWRLDYNTSALRFLLFCPGGTYTATWPTALFPATWYNVSFRFDSVAKAIFLDVNNTGSPVSTSTGADAATNNGSTLFSCGARGGSSNMDGLMQDFYGWTRLLSPAERTALKAGGSAYAWPFR